MTIVKFNKHFPNFIDEFFGGDIFDSPKSSSQIGNYLPAVNVKENENDFEVQVAVPGMKKEDFKIEVQNNILGISSKIREEETEEKENYTRKEFSYQSFSRSFALPKTINEEAIKAQYENGVLKIRIPKKAEEKKANSRLIDIH